MDTAPVLPLRLLLYVIIPAIGTALVALVGVAWSQFLHWRREHDTYEARMAAARKMLAHWERQDPNGRTLMAGMPDKFANLRWSLRRQYDLDEEDPDGSSVGDVIPLSSHHRKAA